jgi:fucose 4-O-acetylase-like acetyltransferase
MQILFAIIAVFWWIAIWGLTDIFIEDWTKEQKLYLYVGILVLVAGFVYVFPNILKRF